MAVLPNSYEEELQRAAYEKKASIFAPGCDISKVYESYPSLMAHQGSWNSWINTASFVRVWEKVFQDAFFHQASWTVKVDPDTVFVPARLISHLHASGAPSERPTYVKNCALSFGFLGAIEIVNRAGIVAFAEAYKGCEQKIGDHSGEDGYLKGCLDMNGVGSVTDTDILQSGGDCSNGNVVAFHPHKDRWDWESCWNTATR